MTFQTLSSIAGNLSLPSLVQGRSATVCWFFIVILIFFIIEYLLHYCQLVFLIAFSFVLKIGLFYFLCP